MPFIHVNKSSAAAAVAAAFAASSGHPAMCESIAGATNPTGGHNMSNLASSAVMNTPNFSAAPRNTMKSMCTVECKCVFAKRIVWFSLWALESLKKNKF